MEDEQASSHDSTAGGRRWLRWSPERDDSSAEKILPWSASHRACKNHVGVTQAFFSDESLNFTGAERSSSLKRAQAQDSREKNRAEMSRAPTLLYFQLKTIKYLNSFVIYTPFNPYHFRLIHLSTCSSRQLFATLTLALRTL